MLGDGLTPSVVHSLLLQAQLSDFFLQFLALTHRAVSMIPALTRMDMEQRVDAFAHVTTIATVTVRLVMMQQLLHFLAVHFLALNILTGATVDKQLEMLFNILLSLASRGFRILVLLRVLFHLHLFQRVLVLCIGILLRCDLAILTEVVVRACLTMPACICYFTVAHITEMGERWCLRIMKVVQDHHGRVFSPSQLVELVMVSNAQRQEGLARVEEIALLLHVWVFTFFRPTCYGFLCEFS